jgi:DNA processing protein
VAELTENLIRLKTAAGVGNAILWRLIREFGGSDGILGAGAGALTRVKGVTAAKAENILAAAKYDPRPELEKALRAGVTVIPYDDPSYPAPLLHSYDPPAVLYVRGRLLPEDQVAIGVVGTRAATPAGRDSALKLSAALAMGGYTVVSGLALGIDAFAHIGAMNAGGRTIGVLGCGFDHMYPEQNRDLALEMARTGAVISEYPMATRPSRDTFPTRNRIIAAMSLGLLVVEAPLRSGALITARIANDIGRTVFALPGRIGDASSEGSNQLIRDGAVLVTGPDDIFRELNPSLPPPEPPERPSRRSGSRSGAPGQAAETAPMAPAGLKPAEDIPGLPAPELSDEQRKLLAAVAKDWLSVDDISAAAGLAAGKTAALLGLLRLRRLVERGPGQMFRRR